MTEPTTNAKTSFRYPVRTKVVIAVVVALAVGGFVFAGMSTNTDTGDDIAVTGDGSDGATGDQMEDDPDGVIRRSPGEDTQVLAQDEVRIQLSPGWTGELTLLPSSGAAVPLPEDEVETTALNELVYEPGEGQTIERLPSGTNCVRATIWDQVEGREATERLEAWCFDVT